MSDCFSKLAKNTGMQETLSRLFFSNMYLHTWCEMKVEAALVWAFGYGNFPYKKGLGA